MLQVWGILVWICLVWHNMGYTGLDGKIIEKKLYLVCFGEGFCVLFCLVLNLVFSGISFMIQYSYDRFNLKSGVFQDNFMVQIS